MALDTMKAKIEIAKSLQQQSASVWAYRVAHYDQLSEQQRLELKEASRKLNARADEVLEDALEEGAGGADDLLKKLEGHSASLRNYSGQLDRIGDVLDVATKIAKAAAGVVSGGITRGLALL
jgi:hypothetical protein